MPKHEPILIFKRLMRLSSKAIVQFINGLFDTAYPVDSTVDYPSTETVTEDLTHSRMGIIMIGLIPLSFWITASVNLKKRR